MRIATGWGEAIVGTPLFGLLLACASATPHIQMHSPNPNGCYVMLFDQPGFNGAADLLNGPGKWPSLEKLRETNHVRWTNRIRSLRVGPAATVAAFAQPEFRGQAQEYHAGSEYATLTAELSGRTQSLTLTCQSAPTVQP
jgi:hypothetical protein